MIWIYTKEVLAVCGFPIDFCKFVILNRDFFIKKCDANFCNNFVILNRDFFIKKCDASLLYFIFKLDGIVFLIQRMNCK